MRNSVGVMEECGQGPKGQESVVEFGVECGGEVGGGGRGRGGAKTKNKIRIEPLFEWG